MKWFCLSIVYTCTCIICVCHQIVKRSCVSYRRYDSKLWGDCVYPILDVPSNCKAIVCILSYKCLHVYTFVVSRAFMAGAADQAGDADSSRAPGLTSGLQGSVSVHRGALLLVPQWQCISSFVFYIQTVKRMCISYRRYAIELWNDCVYPIVDMPSNCKAMVCMLSEICLQIVKRLCVSYRRYAFKLWSDCVYLIVDMLSNCEAIVCILSSKCLKIAKRLFVSYRRYAFKLWSVCFLWGCRYCV